jgi:hypothetical protein
MGSIEILWGLAGVATATLYAGWFGMRVERRYKPALILFMIGSMPLVVIDLAWCAVTTEPFGSRLIVSGLVGAFTGACLLIGATESLRWLVTGAEAQSAGSANGAPPPVVNQGPGSAYSTGQSGGVTAGTIYLGTQNRQITDVQQTTLKQQIGIAGAQIVINPLMPGEQEKFAQSIAFALQAAGASVTVQIGNMIQNGQKGLLVQYDHAQEQPSAIFKALVLAGLNPEDNGDTRGNPIVYIKVGINPN